MVFEHGLTLYEDEKNRRVLVRQGVERMRLDAASQTQDVERRQREAGAQNLSVTNDYVQRIIANAKAKGEKIICFVTGVPGSGKTLAGLNIATQAMEASDNKTGAVFLAGNDPLVNVLQEALAQDQVAQAAARMLGLDAGAMNVAQIIHETHRELFVAQ